MISNLIPGKLYKIISNNSSDLSHNDILCFSNNINLYGFCFDKSISLGSIVLFLESITNKNFKYSSKILYKNKIYIVRNSYLKELNE